MPRPMTDAERWRWIAGQYLSDRRLPCGLIGRSHGLCVLVEDGPRCTVEQEDRMRNALQLFQNGAFGYWWDIPPAGWEERCLAACFLAAMAEADGGNHAG